MKNRIALSSFTMDLKRIALGIYHNSPATVEKFSQEALLRIAETDITKLEPYMQNILAQVNRTLLKPKNQKIAEDYLMYSTLIQNYCLAKLKR